MSSGLYCKHFCPLRQLADLQSLNLLKNKVKGLEMQLSWQNCSLAHRKTWVKSLAPHRTGCGGNTCKPSTWEVKSVGSEVQDYPVVQASLQFIILQPWPVRVQITSMCHHTQPNNIPVSIFLIQRRIQLAQSQILYLTVMYSKPHLICTVYLQGT